MRIDCRTVEAIEPGKQYSHANVRETGECSEGCCVYYECKDCGARWSQELPQ